MIKRCFSCGKGPVAGRTLSRKGQLKKKGGTGSKTTRVNKRTFLPNLQKIRTVVNGKVQKIYLCTKCMKLNRIVKYTRPKYTPAA